MMKANLSLGRLTAGRTAGLPDGYTKKQYAPIKAAGLLKTKKVMAYMAKTDIFIADNNLSHQALEATVEVLCLPGAYDAKLRAAKILLEYTQRKPVSLSETTLKTAEAFLDEIVNDTPAAGDTPPTV